MEVTELTDVVRRLHRIVLGVYVNVSGGPAKGDLNGRK